MRVCWRTSCAISLRRRSWDGCRLARVAWQSCCWCRTAAGPSPPEGPLLVALFVAFSSARAAIEFAAATGFIGVFLFLRSQALRRWKIEPRGHGTLLGPLAARGFVALIAIVVCYALAFGLTEIGVAA